MIRMICFGDSITRGVTYIRGRMRIVKENYPALLQHDFGDDHAEVINKGVFNDNSDLLVQRLDEDVIREKPDIALLEIGGNDCNFHWDEVAAGKDAGDHVPIVPLDRYLNNVREMVVRMQEVGIVPIVMNLLPLDPVRYYGHIFSLHGSGPAHWICRCGGIEHWHGMYNRALGQLLQTLTVRTIDIRTEFKRAADLATLISDDGIHPTAAGYRVMASTIAKNVATVMQTQPEL